jgi:hypothetical protein
MKTKTKDEFIPRALREVWEWRESINQEVKHLPQREALREIMRMAHEAAVAQGAIPATPVEVAETPAKYAAKRKKVIEEVQPRMCCKGEVENPRLKGVATICAGLSRRLLVQLSVG